jgi:hypothetical protein
MTPHERLVIALRHGVLVRGKAMQRFNSEVQALTTRPADADHFSVVPIEAADAISAARRIAEIAARRLYEDAGEVGFLSPQAAPGWYRAAIGEQRRSDDGITTRGMTISIHVWPTD